MWEDYNYGKGGSTTRFSWVITGTLSFLFSSDV